MKSGMIRIVSVLVVLSTVLQLQSASAEDMGTNFFLKASKSVPRIGRRMDLDFMKASKSVPRIGRRKDLSGPTELYYPPQAGKRYYSEKDFGESGQSGWGTDQGMKDMMVGDEPYRGVEEYPYADLYWQQTNKQAQRQQLRQQPLV